MVLYCIYFLMVLLWLVQGVPRELRFPVTQMFPPITAPFPIVIFQLDGVGIDDDIVFYDGMPGDTLNGIVVFVQWKTASTQRYSLI